MGNFNFAGIEGAFKPVSHVLKLSPESDVQRLNGIEKSKPLHCKNPAKEATSDKNKKSRKLYQDHYTE